MPLLFEGHTIGFGYGCPPADLHPPGVLGHPIHPEFVMKVRTAGEAGRADIPDDLSLLDPRSSTDLTREPTEMSVAGSDAVEVPKLDHVAVAPCPPGSKHDAIPGREHRRSGPGRIVGPLVPSSAAEHRVKPAVGEVRGYSAKLDRSPEEGATE